MEDKRKNTQLTLGFAQVQGMIWYRHSESFSGIDVSSRVVVTLGVFVRRSLFGRRACAGQEDKESSAVEQLLLDINAEGKLHYAVALKTRTTRYNYLDTIHKNLLPLRLLLWTGWAAAAVLSVALSPSSGANWTAPPDQHQYLQGGKRCERVGVHEYYG